jgi:antitoxin (DNA-binding transcriptional repressor) of toxin-antitoxin stability system
MPHTSRALTAAVLGLATILTAGASSAQRERTLVLSVVDGSGRPVTDLQADDVRVREDGVDGEVTGLKRAPGALYLQVLVDTTPGTEPYVSDIRKALAAFIQRVKAGDPAARLGLMEFGQAAAPIVPITDSADDLDKGITRIFPKPRSASVLLEAIVAASNSLMPQPGPRRAIVSFNTEPSDEQSRESPKRMLQALGLSGAQVWSVSLQTLNRNNPNRDIVLNEVAKVTGGRREIVVASSAIQGYLETYADALLAQYEMTYRMPGDRPAKVVQTGTTRPGARVHASTLPQQPR